MSGRFGDEKYAMEELIAEISAAFICSDLAVPHNPQDNTASYIHNWLQVLKNDPKAIFTAASRAQSVADFLHALQTDERKAA